MQNENYTRENTLLNMVAVPYFGVYSENYTFYHPIKTFFTEKVTQEMYDSFPEIMRRNISQILNNHNIPLEYLHVTIDGSAVSSKYTNNTQNGFLRLNFIPHPYIFSDVTNLNKNHETNIFSGIFTNQANQNYIQETNEFDGLRLNPMELINDINKKEIILHSTQEGFPAISPNNCAILVNINSCFFSLYNMTLVTLKNKIVKMVITQFYFINTTNFTLIDSYILNTGNNSKEISELSFNIEMIRNIIETTSNSFLNKNFDKNVIKNMFNCILNMEELQQSYLVEEYYFIESSNDKSIDFYYEDLCKFIWQFFGCPNIDNFGEEILYLNQSDSNYRLFSIEIVKKYLRSFISIFDDYLNSQFLLFKSLNLIESSIKKDEVRISSQKDKIIKEYLEKINKKNDFKIEITKQEIKKHSNPVIENLREILDDAFNVNKKY